MGHPLAEGPGPKLSGEAKPRRERSLGFGGGLAELVKLLSLRMRFPRRAAAAPEVAGEEEAPSGLS